MKVKMDNLKNKRTTLWVLVATVILVAAIVGFYLLRNDETQNNADLNEIENIDAATLDGIEAAEAFESLAENQEGIDRAYFYENSGDDYFDAGKYDEAVAAYAKAKAAFKELNKEIDEKRLQQKEDEASFKANFEDYELEDEGVPFVPGETEPGE